MRELGEIGPREVATRAHLKIANATTQIQASYKKDVFKSLPN